MLLTAHCSLLIQSMDKEKMLESIEKMSVLELAELVKAIEEKFGVTAAAPVMMGTMPTVSGGDEGGTKEEKTSFNVELKDGGSQKIQVIKALRELTQMGLKEAKDLVDAAPKMVKEGVDKATADEMKSKLEAAGATVEIK